MDSSQVMAEYRRAHNIGEVPVVDMDAGKLLLFDSHGTAYKEVDTNIWMDLSGKSDVAYVGTSRHAGGVVLRPLFIRMGDEWYNAVTGHETDFPRWKNSRDIPVAAGDRQVGSAVKNSNGAKKPEERRSILKGDWKERSVSLVEVCESFTWSIWTKDLYRHMCEAVADALCSDEVYLALIVAEGTRRFGTAYHTDGSELYRWEGEYGPSTSPNLRWMMDVTEPFVMDLDLERIPDLVESGYVKTQARCAVVIPVQSRGVNSGLCYVLFSEMQHIDDEDKVYLSLAGRILGSFAKRVRDARSDFELHELDIRRSLSHEIRDNVVTLMGSLSLNAAAASASLEDGDVKAARIDLERLENAASKAMGMLSDELSLLDVPLDESHGFVNGVETCLAQFETSWGIKTHLDVSQLVEERPVRLVVGLQLTRILGECLSNILKYAHAENVRVSITDDTRCFSMIVEDDGVGFDVEKLGEGSNGIDIMRKRAQAIDAELSIFSGSTGTSVCVDVPYEKSRRRGR